MTFSQSKLIISDLEARRADYSLQAHLLYIVDHVPMPRDEREELLYLIDAISARTLAFIAQLKDSEIYKAAGVELGRD